MYIFYIYHLYDIMKFISLNLYLFSQVSNKRNHVSLKVDDRHFKNVQCCYVLGLLCALFLKGFSGGAPDHLKISDIVDFLPDLYIYCLGCPLPVTVANEDIPY